MIEKPLYEKKISELFSEEMWDGRIKKHVFGIPEKDLKAWAVAVVKEIKKRIPRDYIDRHTTGMGFSIEYGGDKEYHRMEAVASFLIDRFELTEEDING